MRVLFLGSHCDDLELGCGGTIHKRHLDWDITCATMSTYGICNGEKINVKDYSNKALSFLGVSDSRYNNFPPNEFASCRQKIWEHLHHLDVEIKPDIVFTVEKDDQQDHETLYKEVIRNFRKSSIISYKATIRNSPECKQNYFEILKIDNLKAKQKAISNYPSSYQKYIYFSPKNIEAITRYGGIYVEEEFAETFNIVKWIVK